ncbi:MlaD family protein [Endozoicomonas sp. 8E]|uniref:MlaD family protein n=1 Tax=Endozoicomonas sp. 8E TaxID=3035692 RepID=UPI0029393BDD|nr:MlaD family protein [Endozoicomonas sp. 8E]WOG29491.1 MlaD family protein [Endozoicomonas sp. 8E]
MMNKKRYSIFAGLFVITMIGLTVGLAMFVGQGSYSSHSKERYELIYDSSVMGLNIGAPVTLRGVKIGEVTDIRTQLYVDKEELLNTVMIDIYPDMVVGKGGKVPEDIMKQLVFRGLAAKLKTQSLLTGLLYVEVDFYKTSARTIPVSTQYPQLPTVPTDFETITQDLDEMNLPALIADLKSIAHNLNTISSSQAFQQMPTKLNKAFAQFGAMSEDMAKSMSDIRDEFVPMADSMNQMSQAIERELPKTLGQVSEVLSSVEATLKALEQTTMELSDTVAPDSPLMYQLDRSSKDISRSADAVRELAELLEEQPGSVLLGRDTGE